MAGARRGITKSGLAPRESALERFQARTGQPSVSKGNKSDPKRLILDVAVGFQCRILSKSFAASWCLTCIWPNQIVRKEFLQPYVKGPLT
jgi:hypothetical protein